MKSILVVDDDFRHDKMMGYLLTSKGFDVSYALSGEEALEKLRSSEFAKPDIVILDVMMPRMNGIETLIEMRKEEDLMDIPVLMVSAISTPEKVSKAKEAGAADYISKPFSSSNLIEKINFIIAGGDG